MRWELTPVLISNLVIAVFLLGAQLTLRPASFLRVARLVFWILIFGGIFLASYLTYQQYNLWLAHPISRLLLPPHQSIWYFFYYALNNFYLATVLASLAALVVLLAANLLNKKFQARFFEPAEPYVLGSAILLVGHPAWLYYLPSVLIIYLLLATFYFLLFRSREKRLSFYYFWLPVAALVIMSSKVISLVAKP